MVRFLAQCVKRASKGLAANGEPNPTPTATSTTTTGAVPSSSPSSSSSSSSASTSTSATSAGKGGGGEKIDHLARIYLAPFLFDGAILSLSLLANVTETHPSNRTALGHLCMGSPSAGGRQLALTTFLCHLLVHWSKAAGINMGSYSSSVGGGGGGKCATAEEGGIGIGEGSGGGMGIVPVGVQRTS